MALKISIDIIRNFIANSPYTFKIRNINSYIPRPTPQQRALAMTRGYSDAKRVCRCIKNAVYTSGNFKGQNVLGTIFSEINHFIHNLNSYPNQNSFDQAHDNLCLSICGNYNGYNSVGKPCSHRITYGIAQKILNMTLKYMYVEHRLNPSFGLLPNNVEGFFHCPVDSYILSGLNLVNNTYNNS